MASASIQLPNFELKVLNDDKSIEDSTIFDVKNNRPMVIDLWHTKCKNCPAALEKLNKIAIKRTDILFVACAISQGEGNEEEVADLIDEWNGLSHVYISIEVKEQLKAIFGFTQVPFAIVIDVNGNVSAKGDPKTIDFANLSFKSNITNENSDSTNIISVPSAVAGNSSGFEMEKLAVNLPSVTERPTFTLDEDF